MKVHSYRFIQLLRTMFMEESVCEMGSQLETSLDGEGAAEQLLASEQQLAAKQKELQNASACGFLSPSTDDGMLLPQKEGLRRPLENKLKYKKLKQKLGVLCEQIQDQGLLKDQKDLASPNKSRLVKLALELEKSLRTQAIDYSLVESLLREIQKIVEYRREQDILILRGARMLSTLFTIIKRFPSLHRNEANQSAPALEMTLKLLRIMMALSSTRECLLVTNQMITLSSLLSCALMREDRKTAVICLNLLNLLLAGPNRIQLHPLISANVEYILCSSLLKRLKTYLESCLQEDDPSHAEFLHLAFKFYHLILSTACKQELQRPIYASRTGMDGLVKAISGYFESGIQLLTQSVIELVYQKEEGEKYAYREEHIPNFKINILLSIFKALNIIFHVDIFLAQKVIECNGPFMDTLLFVFGYAKENFQESAETRRLCSQIIIFLGSLAFQNYHYQEAIRASGLLQSLCNHPLEYLMEPALRNIIVPTYCCLLHDNPANFQQTFAESSVQPIVQFIEKEIYLCKEREEASEISLGGKNVPSRTLSRKTSVSSLNSTYSKASMAESYSTQTSNTIRLPDYEIRLEHRFRPQFWEQLIAELKKIED